MAEKALKAAEWKKFSKGRKLGDGKLVDALDALERADDDAARVAALDALEPQVKTLAKAAKGDREVSDYLEDMGKELIKARREAEADARKAAAEPEEDEKDAELYGKSLLKLLRAVQAGARYPAMIAVAGKEAQVLVMRKAIPLRMRQEMKERMGGGSVRVLPGECLLEQEKVTFVLEGPASGLARPVRTAIRAQTGSPMAVRVRGPEAGDIDEAEDDAEAAPVAASAAAPPPPPPPPRDAQQDACQEWFSRREPVVRKLLDNPAIEGRKIQALLAFAHQKADGASWAAAAQALREIDKLVPAATAAGAASDTAPPPPPPAPPPPPGGATTAPAASAKPAAGNAEQDAFRARMTALMAAMKDLASADPQRAQLLRAKLSEAGLAAGKRDLPTAGALLDQAQALLDQPASAAPEPAAPRASGKLVAQRQFLIQRWKQIQTELRGHCQALQGSMQGMAVDDDPAELAQLVNDWLDALLEDLQDRIDEGINRGDMSVVQGLQAEVAGDPLLDHLLSVPSMDGSVFLKSVQTALAEVEAALTT